MIGILTLYGIAIAITVIFIIPDLFMGSGRGASWSTRIPVRLLRAALLPVFGAATLCWTGWIGLWFIGPIFGPPPYTGGKPLRYLGPRTGIIGVPVRSAVPIWSTRGVKRIGTLEDARLFSPPRPDRDWIDYDAGYGRAKGRIRRRDVSFLPEDIGRYIEKYGGYDILSEGLVSVRDFNGDNHLEVLLAATIDHHFYQSYEYFLYGFLDDEALPYLTVRCDHYDLHEIALPDGTIGFTNTPLMWQHRCYRWSRGKYRNCWCPSTVTRPNTLHTFWCNLFQVESVTGLIIGLAPALFLVLFLVPMLSPPDLWSLEGSVVTLDREKAIKFSRVVAALTIGVEVFVFWFAGYDEAGVSLMVMWFPLLPVVLVLGSLLKRSMREVQGID